MSHLIAPSLLAANFLNLEKDLEMLNRVKPTGYTLILWMVFCSQHFVRISHN